jgi:hypothetical protein
MRRTILIGVLVTLAVALIAPRAALGCGRGGYGSGSGFQGLGIAAVAVVATDAILTVWDAQTMFVSHPPSAVYGTVETILALPQLAIGIAGLTLSNGNPYFVGYTFWMAALTMHGIWSMAAGARAPAPPEILRLGQSSGDASSGLEVFVGPTYVPLGQLAHPGFGLTGRF